MTFTKPQRRLAILLQLLLLGITMSGCSKAPGTDQSKLQDNSAYNAACHGGALTEARREQAVKNGWTINGAYNCVDKNSYDQWAATKSQDELVADETAFDDRQAQAKEDRKQELVDNEQYIAEALANMNTQPLEANTAYYFELGMIVGVGGEAGMQIKQAREKRPFTDWDDLLERVPVFKVVETAHDASIAGMTVNGKSLPGADPDPEAAAAIYEKHLRKFFK